MKFRTEIEPLAFPFCIEVESKIISLGSCFAQVIGSYFDSYKINNLTNPYGTLFNPISIAQNLLDALKGEEVNNEDTIISDGLNVHYAYHSEIASTNKEDLSLIIRNKNTEVANRLKSSDILILTFGTAWIHVLKKKQKIVANCHKQESSQFTKRLITNVEFNRIYEELLKELQKINPSIQILVSVSPVIHSREGLVGNSLSKSALVYFSNLLAAKYENVSYFPGYEIIRDDLRDYRFFKEDLIHPTTFSERYILDYFLDQLGSKQLKEHFMGFKKILDNMNHRPFRKNSESYLNHLKNTEKQLLNYPYNIDLEKERMSISQKIEEIEKAIRKAN